MDLQSHPTSEHGRFEQIVTQFFLKTLHIILNSRVPSIHPYSCSREVKNSDKWFSLVLGNRPAPLDNLNFWRRNLMEPMIIDIILVQGMSSSISMHGLGSPSGLGMFVETVIERWTVQYEHPRKVSPQVGDTSYRKTYKKLIILLRSLYSTMRLLPAHKAFRKLCSLTQACEFDINYRVSSFGTPFSRAEEDLMKQYAFISVDAPQGRLSVSVTYRESLSDFNLETCTSFPPQIIQDYVGSPAIELLRAFPSSEKDIFATSFPSSGVQPLSAQFQRPHTWTSGLHGGARLAQNNPVSGSPPTYHYPSSPSDLYGHRIQNYRLKGAAGSVDYQLSPPFSPSPSPSSPSYLAGGNLPQAQQRPETAPVSIPHPMMGRNSRSLSPNLSDPNRHLLPPISPRTIKHDSSSRESPSGTRSFRKSDSLRSGDLSSGTTNYHTGHKVSRDARDDSGRFSGLLSSSGSPRIGLSRSSSRVSFQDDLDDCDFSCPFIVDDVDTSDVQPSQTLGKKAAESPSQSGSMTRRSQDAAVGVLVHMLRTAPPLRQDSSCYSSYSMKTEPQGRFGSNSGFFLHRKTSDALEELRGYKEMKELLLSKSGSRSNEEA